MCPSGYILYHLYGMVLWVSSPGYSNGGLCEIQGILWMFRGPLRGSISLGCSAILWLHRIQSLIPCAAAFVCVGGRCWLSLGSVLSWFWVVLGVLLMLPLACGPGQRRALRGLKNSGPFAEARGFTHWSKVECFGHRLWECLLELSGGGSLGCAGERASPRVSPQYVLEPSSCPLF